MSAQAPTDPADLDLVDAAALLRSGKLSAVELLDACEARIAERNGGPPSFDGAPDAVNAWVRLYPEIAREQARAADERRDADGAGALSPHGAVSPRGPASPRGAVSPHGAASPDGAVSRRGAVSPHGAASPDGAVSLRGIPLALKDLFAVAGLPLTASSRVLEGNVAQSDSAAWRRLRARGVVLMGHTHTHEFAAGGTTDQVGNPWALERTAGGSSGGSAAALATGMAPAALGTDTAGSVRIPAGLTGVSSIKPTHGRVPMDGLIPLSPTLDHIGPMARTVADCSALLSALATEPGERPDPVIAALPVTARGGPRPLAGLRVALTDRPNSIEVDADVLEGLEAARAACERLGAEIVDLPAAPGITPDDSIRILFHEVWPYHAGLTDRADGYRPAIRQFMELAERVYDPAAYAEAQSRRAEVTAGWRSWFGDNGVDLLLEPTVPMTARPRGDGYEPDHLGGEGDPLIAFTATWNFMGFPVVAIPTGLGARSGLPVGVSLIGATDSEPLLTQAGIDLQAHALPPLRLP
jgi:aspartyl-tRNA(Asn)/glutamyl-tRNA(Gln) amidotransferase subunit A